jgi:putative hydrolase of the HAD superfamily
MGIVSNAQSYTPLLFQAFLDDPYTSLGFDERCCVWSYKELEGKPSANLYSILLNQLDSHHGIEREQCLYIGNDMRNDMWPAFDLGIRTALFAGDGRSLRLREDDPYCNDVVPDLVVTDLLQLLDCLGLDK